MSQTRTAGRSLSEPLCPPSGQILEVDAVPGGGLEVDDGTDQIEGLAQRTEHEGDSGKVAVSDHVVHISVTFGPRGGEK